MPSSSQEFPTKKDIALFFLTMLIQIIVTSYCRIFVLDRTLRIVVSNFERTKGPSNGMLEAESGFGSARPRPRPARGCNSESRSATLIVWRKSLADPLCKLGSGRRPEQRASCQHHASCLQHYSALILRPLIAGAKT